MLSKIVDNSDKIEHLITNIHFLVFEIKRLDKFVDNLENNNTKQLYLFNLLDTIVKFNEINEELKKELELFFVYERENNLPNNFNYKRLYKAL